MTARNETAIWVRSHRLRFDNGYLSERERGEKAGWSRQCPRINTPRASLSECCSCPAGLLRGAQATALPSVAGVTGRRRGILSGLKADPAERRLMPVQLSQRTRFLRDRGCAPYFACRSMTAESGVRRIFRSPPQLRRIDAGRLFICGEKSLCRGDGVLCRKRRQPVEKNAAQYLPFQIRSAIDLVNSR
jgi:hypothetical protein